MKRILLFSTVLLYTVCMSAQTGTWTIKLNDKEIITTAEENPEVNCKKIRASDWKKSGNLTIRFTENEPDMWIRTFFLNDEDDNELKRFDSTTNAVISLKELRTVFQGKKKMILYSVITPRDPTIAIRIRRVHLYTFVLP